jgi:hypothetical protein
MSQVELKTDVITYMGKEYLRVGSSYYPIDEEHTIDKIYLDKAIETFEAVAATFAKDCILDSYLRKKYLIGIQRVSKDVKAEVNARKITISEGAEFAHQMRNEILVATRSVTSPQTLAYILPHKPVPPELMKILDEKSMQKFQKPFSDLSKFGKNRILYITVSSAGRDSPKYTAKAKKLQIMGRVLIAVTVGIAVYSIVNAENKKKETVKQGTSILGGLGGGALGGIGASVACGPGAVICAITWVAAGGIIGSIAVSNYFDPLIDDVFDEEVEEFSKWELN